MTDREIYNKYMNMVGDDPHKIRVLKELTAKSGKVLREIIKQQEAVKDEPDILEGHPHTATEPIAISKKEHAETISEARKLIPAAVFNAITDNLEALDVSIKFLESKIYADQEHKKKLEEEYKELSKFLKAGGKNA